MVQPDHVRTTRTAYDATADVYASLVGTEVTAAFEAPLDRAILGAFVEMAGDGPDMAAGSVADIGCGTGRVAAFVARHGLRAVGIDVAPGMLAVARGAHPEIPFVEGRLTDLPLADGSLRGAVSWYSVIHTPPALLSAIGRELARVLAPGGHVLVAFQAGAGERLDREVGEQAIPLTNYRHDPDDVARCLTAAGLEVCARAVREAELAHEASPQAFVIARAARLGP